MEYTLTTGEMIDQIFPGEVYETELPETEDLLGGKVRNYVTLDDKGSLSYSDKEGSHRAFIDFYVNRNTRDLKWRLVPKYVPFTQAMAAYERGETVTSHHDVYGDYRFNINNCDFFKMHNSRIKEGKWSIQGRATV